VNAFLGELGKKLAERWLTLLVLPGLLYLSVLTVAAILGQHHATDVGMLRAWVDTAAAAPASSSPAVVLAGAIGILSGAAGAGLAATALGQLIQQVWTTPGRRAPARWLTRWRRDRWNRAYATVRTTLEDLATARADTTPNPSLASRGWMRRWRRVPGFAWSPPTGRPGSETACAPPTNASTSPTG